MDQKNTWFMLGKISNIASNFWKHNIPKLFNIESIKNELKWILEK
jgi:hypothetical protein